MATSPRSAAWSTGRAAPRAGQHIGRQLDPAKPQILIYEPVGGKLPLAAAEWFVPTDHYDLHVWLWKENPAGMFSQTNPALKCPKGSYSFDEKAPKIVHTGGH